MVAVKSDQPYPVPTSRASRVAGPHSSRLSDCRRTWRPARRWCARRSSRRYFKCRRAGDIVKRPREKIDSRVRVDHSWIDAPERW